jgi:peroxiredoxin
MRTFLHSRYLLLAGVIALVGAAALLSAQEGGRPIASSANRIADFSLHDYLGAKHSLADWRDKQAIVIVFLGTDCPVSKLYGSRLAQMAKEYADQQVQFVGIDANRQDTLEEIGQFARAHKIEFPILKDAGNQVADQFGAQRMSEAFLLDKERIVRYRGRIDDQFGVGYARGQTIENHLVTALDELLAGKPVSTPAVEAVGCFIGRVNREPATGDVTYTKSIAPILDEHCVRCHREGEVAPFALTSYEEVLGWGDTIVEVTRNERMPPWHANPAHGQFGNDARLPDEAKELIATWVKNGSPQGDPADRPAPPTFVDGWQIPKPDILLEMPRSFDVPARGVVPYQHFYIEKALDEETWVRAAELRPGNRAVVHHLILFYVPPGQARHRGEDALENNIVSFAPGLPAMNLPDGYALRIPAGARLVFQAHYTPNGSPQTDRSMAGLVFADPKSVKHELNIEAALNFRFRIPPGDNNYRISANYRVGQDSILFALTPHMHYRGKSFRFTARYPDGRQEILLDVPSYDFNWQNVYELAEPKRLPEATEVQLVAHYDNSADNPLNPDATKAVMWGDQTWEEMMIGTLTLSPAEQDLTVGPPQVEAIEGNDRLRRVHFRYKPTQPANKVYLAGSFNEWKPGDISMVGPDEDGFYKTTLNLAPGEYEYKFTLDGTTWRPDPGNREQTGYFLNSVLHVE